MNEITDRILEPAECPENWVCMEFDDSIHVFPSFGPKHKTKDCWCRPEVTQDELMMVPLYSHRELH